MSLRPTDLYTDSSLSWERKTCISTERQHHKLVSVLIGTLFVKLHLRIQLVPFVFMTYFQIRCIRGFPRGIRIREVERRHQYIWPIYLPNFMQTSEETIRFGSEKSSSFTRHEQDRSNYSAKNVKFRYFVLACIHAFI